MAGKPLWLLDVDGVLNAIEPKPKHVTAWDGYEHADVRADRSTYRISYAPTLVLGIRELIEDGNVEVMWLTTWQEHANEALRKLFGFPELAIASTREDFLSPAATWWKLTVAKRVAKDRPLIWTDDDLQNDEGARWVTERPWPTLAIAPSYRGGLQPTEFQMIYDFISAHAERDTAAV